MAQECGFFNAQLVGGEYDRVYLAEQFAAYFASFIGNGIFGGQMQQLEVVANSPANMSVIVLSGKGWINGWWYRNNGNMQLSVAVADGVLSRIDSVVVRWDNTRRDMYLHVIKGTPSNNPVKPSVVRNNDYYDIQLCTISIPAGSTGIRQQQITDTRLDNSVCGLVTGVVNQINTTGLFDQFQSAFRDWKSNQQSDYERWVNSKQSEYNNFVQTSQNNYNQYTTDKQNEFNAWYNSRLTSYQALFENWFEGIRNQLSTDVAGNLQNQVNALKAQVSNDDNIVVVNVVASQFSNTLPYKSRINVSGIKVTDKPEVTQNLPSNITDKATVSKMLKSASMVDRIVTGDGYIDIFCYRKKPVSDFYLNLKGVSRNG